MSKDSQQRRFNLENRTFEFAQSVRAFVRRLPRTICNQEDVRQLARSSDSVGAKYIEANSALGRKDFVMRIRIARKEAKESAYWLRLIDTKGSEDLDTERDGLVQENVELMKILGAILKKSLSAEKV